MTNTMAVVIAVSRRDGQVTLRVSSRTCWRNLNGDVAIQYSLDLKCGSTFPSHGRLCAGRPINAGPQPRRKVTTPTCNPRFWRTGLQIASSTIGGRRGVTYRAFLQMASAYKRVSCHRVWGSFGEFGFEIGSKFAARTSAGFGPSTVRFDRSSHNFGF